LLGEQQLTNATGFFFERDGRLFLVTNRHVVLDEPSDHRPDRLEIELHVDPENVAVTTGFAIPLYRGTQPVWREGIDPAGTVDVVALQLERAALPEKLLLQPFTPNHLVERRGDDCLSYHRQMMPGVVKTQRETDDQHSCSDFYLVQLLDQMIRRKRL